VNILGNVLGVDIGGTKILAGIIDEKGILMEQIKVSSDAKSGREVLLSNLFKCMDELVNGDIRSIGVCIPGFVNYNTGTIEYAAGNMPGLTGCRLGDVLKERYKIPVIIENDANAAAFGEGWVGGAKGVKDYAMISLGTGIGGAIVVNGELSRGANWCAGEFGHSILIPGGKACSCGEKGCLEMYASGTAIYKRFNELLGQNKLGGAKEVFELLKDNDKIAIQVIEEFAFYISVCLKNIGRYINSEVIILGGGLIDARELWWDKVMALIPKEIIISPAHLGSTAAMFGAAKLSMDSVLK
jgi:glucokinase